MRHHRLGPLGNYVRARLHRRLFLWFGAAIVVTALSVSASYAVLGHIDEPGWRRDWDRGRDFIGRQLALNWNEPGKNQALIRDVSETFKVDVELRATDGSLLQREGGSCDHPGFSVPVMRGAEQLGTLSLCFSRRAASTGWRPFAALFIAIGVLWAASGKIARRLARPLDELANVAKRIGEGDLKARSQFATHAPGEIGLVAEALNEMATRIEKQVADQRELLAAVSHELRTPLARVRIITELGRDNGADPKARTWDDLDREVVEMDALVGQLLASARVDFGALTLRELQIGDLVTRAVERAGLPASVLALQTERTTVAADATLLARALANLFDNARRHAGGAQQLVVREAGGNLFFEVLDAGPGLPAGVDPFAEPGSSPTPAHNGDTRGDGLGLGLRLVKRIAQAHGGAVFASNRPEGGARVGLSVPIVVAPVAPSA